MPHFAFSTWCDGSGGDQPSAIGASIEVGEDRQVKRLPIAVARAVAKLADGAETKLTPDDINKIGNLDITLKPLRDGKYTAAVPVRVLTWFIPAGMR